jgi:hypothetical protein
MTSPVRDLRLTALMAGAVLLSACGGGSDNSTAPEAASGTAQALGLATSRTSPPVSEAPPVPTVSSIDPTKIPLGDEKLSTTTPAVGYVYACTIPSSPNAPTRNFWISADGKTWNSTTKIAVQGAVSWVSELTFALTGTRRNVTGNDLPSHTTGTFPIARNDPAHAYDGNPNTIQAVAIAWGLPANPVVAATPRCTGLGAIGVLLTGARIFNALDADGLDAVAHEVQDQCDGHPQGASIYHYHNLSRCALGADDPTAHSPLVGYIADGFGLYGNRGEGGQPLTNADLDACHGHSHSVVINGVPTVQYHYHATKEYPYTVGCFKGTPVVIR